MRTIIRLAGLSVLMVSFLAMTTISEASVAVIDSGVSSHDDCAKKRARGRKCDDDKSNRNSNVNGNSNSNSNHRSNGNRNSNGNGNGNRNSNKNNKSNNNGNSYNN